MRFRFRRSAAAAVMALSLATPVLQGCATDAVADPRVVAAEMDQPFMNWSQGLVKQIKSDPSYSRIPLDTDAQRDEFLVWMHDAYRQRVTRQEFAAWINSRYPHHQHEAAFIVSRLP